MYIKDEFKGRSRRRYSAQFKQELVILCRQPGMSVASVTSNLPAQSKEALQRLRADNLMKS
jgi:hypothetical protein